MRLVLCVVAGRRKPSKTHGQGAPLNPSAVRLLFLHQKDYMSKADDLLEYFKNHVGEWACSMCGSHSVQPAATFRTLKNAGWQFEEISPQRWGKQMFCPVCGQETTHYKLKSLQQGLDKSRLGITPAQKKRVISIIGDVDAFTGASVKSSLEIDHKVPFDRLKETVGDIDIDKLSDVQITEHFQILTRDHNLLKDRACQSCIKTGVRPPLFGIKYWYDGDGRYIGSCRGCGWYDGAEWRRILNERLANEL